MANAYQTVNFHFRVNFDLDSSGSEIGFQSVTGLDSTIETESIKEGGENGFTHKAPLRRSHTSLVLKRGLISPSQSKITSWLQDAFNNETVEPRQQVMVVLLDEESNPLMHWTLTNVWPISWKMGELNAEQGAVMIETLELNYNKLSFDDY
ncbi:MAG TPA: phage tail protein [Chitinophagaceae bacterium]|jgi:phage tail-like protein